MGTLDLPYTQLDKISLIVDGYRLSLFVNSSLTADIARSLNRATRGNWILPHRNTLYGSRSFSNRNGTRTYLSSTT